MLHVHSNAGSLNTDVLYVLLICSLFGCTEQASLPSETETFESQPMTSSGAERRIESPEASILLTREESLGAACMPLELRPDFGVCKATNPNARSAIADILTLDENRGVEVRDYQIGAMYCLGYIGENEDALAIERFLRTGHKYVGQPFGTSRFMAAYHGVALMARRDIPEAKRIMADIVRPEYWKDVATPVQRFDGLNPLEEDLVLAVYASAIANGSPDVNLVKRIIDTSVHKELMSRFLSPELVAMDRLSVIKSEKQPVSDQWRELLLLRFRVHYTEMIEKYGNTKAE